MSKQVENSTYTLQQTIELQLENSIRAYLRSKVEMATQIIGDAIDDESEEHLESSVDILQKLIVGRTGYFYAVDSSGKVVFHPDESIVGTNQSGKEPVDQQVSLKSGYLEYMWQNSDESESLPKALYMEYIPELDWIVTATSYRNEFTTMVDIESIQQIVAESSVGIAGYSYVIDQSGRMIAHPYFSDYGEMGTLVSRDEYNTMIEQLFEQKNGYAGYRWRDGPLEAKREKVVYLKYLPDFDWVVGTAISRSEMTRSTLLFVILDISVALVLGLLLAYTISKANGSIEHQLKKITDVLKQGRRGDLSVRVEEAGPDELVELSRHVNYFLESLQNLNISLENRIEKRTEELTQASNQLMEAEKLALTSRLVTGVAHEINNPVGIAMTGVSYVVDTLGKLNAIWPEEKQVNNDVTEMLESSLESARISMKNLQRAGDLVASFKSVSSDQLGLNRRIFRLVDVVNDVLLSMQPSLRLKTLDINIDVPDLVLDSYPGVFVHLLVNLITNSLVHGFHNRQEGAILIRAIEADGIVTMEYRDDGAGISPEIIPTVFDPFFTTRRNDGSIGLGLNIVFNLVKEKLGGTMDVNSRVGEYSLFVVKFPREI
ncbi:MAG: cache domain-containing protein [Spirochaetaceae bacterium]|nr:cache domain-containing protein [Spirochaetaceae bacterium]